MFCHRLSLQSGMAAMGYFRWGTRTAELSSCSSAQVLQPGSAGWEGMQHPRSILAAPRSRAAVAPAGRSQHCQRILLLPSLWEPGGTRSLQDSRHKTPRSTRDTRHKKPRGSAGTAHPTAMQKEHTIHPGQKDHLASLSSLCVSTLPSFHPLQI